MTEAVRREVELDASLEEVWASLADPRRLSAWLGGTVELALRTGGRGTIRRDDGAVRRVIVEAVEPGRRLVLRWWPFEEPDEPGRPGPSSRVELAVEAGPRGTTLHVVEWAPLPSMGSAGHGSVGPVERSGSTRSHSLEAAAR